MSFTYTQPNKEAEPIALVRSKVGRGIKLVYLSEESPEESTSTSINDIIFKEHSARVFAQALANGLTIKDIEDGLKIGNNSQRNLGSQISLSSNEVLEPIPSPHKPDRTLVSGGSGVGKSTLVMEMIAKYAKFHPKNRIVLFLRQEDPAFDRLDDIDAEVTEIIVDEKILEMKITLDDLEDSLVVFDDMDNITNKKLNEFVHRIVNDILTNGRKRNISCTYINHAFLSGLQSKIVNHESNKVFFFPASGIRQTIAFLKEYLGMLKHEIETVTKLPSRWVMISRTSPRYVLYEKGALII
jgi:hypothetical protein